MSSSLALKVGNVTSAINFGKTDQEVAQILGWFIKNWADPMPEGLTTATNDIVMTSLVVGYDDKNS